MLLSVYLFLVPIIINSSSPEDHSELVVRYTKPLRDINVFSHDSRTQTQQSMKKQGQR